MRILTLNTHSHLEENYEMKCRIFADAIVEYTPDIIALQEVNQTDSAPKITNTDKIFSIGSVTLTEDNHALQVARLISRRGIDYNVVWAGIKKGYKKFDEGIAVMSLAPIETAHIFAISKNTDYQNWKTRKALIASAGGVKICSVHLGWWNDTDEPFESQFDKLDNELKKRGCNFVAGDFNSPDNVTNEGYAFVRNCGWNDTFVLADIRKGHHTTNGAIAGWEQNEPKRIDYIFSADDVHVTECCTIFDGERYPQISDHYGVMTDISGGKK